MKFMTSKVKNRVWFTIILAQTKGYVLNHIGIFIRILQVEVF